MGAHDGFAVDCLYFFYNGERFAEYNLDVGGGFAVGIHCFT